MSTEFVLSSIFNTNFSATDAINGSLNDSSEDNWEQLMEMIRKSTNKPIPTSDLIKNVFIILFYSLIIVISLFGNFLVVKVILFGKKKMLTTTNLLIVSLAFSDIVMTAFNIPFNVSRLLMKHWPFGAFMCVSVPFVQVSCVYVSTFTMTVIAYHRWWTLRRNEASRTMTKKQMSLTIGSIWLLAAILSIPHSAFHKLYPMPNIAENFARCDVDYPNIGINFQLWLSVEALTTQYFIPLSVTILLYINIGRIINKQGLIAGLSNDERKRQQSEARKRRIVMLILVVTVFAICW